jgi:hypothetical protein
LENFGVRDKKSEIFKINKFRRLHDEINIALCKLTIFPLLR